MRELNILTRILLVVFALTTLSARSDELHIQPGVSTLIVGNSVSLSAVHDTAGNVTTDPETVWTVDNSNVATVTGTGVVTAVAPGQVLVFVVNNELDGTPSGSVLLRVYAAGDADSDGLPDAWETQYGLNPNDDSDALLDPDQDSLNNIEELAHDTHPDNPDTDGDGRPDGDEVVTGLDPAVAEVLQTPKSMDDHCVVAILNRVARVRSNGTWVLTNIPATGQQVRARATCQTFGRTEIGQSDYIVVPPNGQLQNVRIDFENPIPVPSKLTLAAALPRIDQIGATLPLTSTLTYSNDTTADATPATKGTNYISSNPAIATISENGVVTAVAPGGVNISATNEGTLALLHIEVTGFTDTDQDGMPDEWETANNLNPNDPSDAGLDADDDGLTNVAEFQHGSDPHVADTDGDGVYDGLEVQLGTNPIDPSSVDLQHALTGIAIRPSSFTITLTPVIRYLARQIHVIGTMTDGHTVDLTTAAKGTLYTSTDLEIASFENANGVVASGTPGQATITATNSGFTATAPATIRNLNPAVAMLPMPGLAKNVKVAGNFAFVAAADAGLVIVDVSDRAHPAIVTTIAIPGGSANDVRVDYGVAYVAAGPAGLQIFDIRNPHAPFLLGALDTPGDARDVIVSGRIAYVADAAAGVRVISVADPATPVEIGSFDTTQECQNVAISGSTLYAAVGNNDLFASSVRLFAIDVHIPSAPAALGTFDTFSAAAGGLDVNGTHAYLAGRTGGLLIIDVTHPDAMSIESRTPSFYPLDVVVSGKYAFCAEELRVNSVPILDVTDARNPFYAAAVDLDPLGDADGHGLDVDESYVYLAADSELYIAQHHGATDEDGVAPIVRILAPVANTPFVPGDRAPIRIEATDDFGIAGVATTINGLLVPGLSKPPYSANVNVPAGTASITLDVTATDFGGNTGHVVQTHTVTSDPGTTVTGRVLVAEGIPAGGAAITANGKTGTTDGTGAYHIENVPTVDGDFVVTALLHDGGRTVGGQSAPVTPVRGGITNVPDIYLRAGLHVLITSPVAEGTPLSEWQPLPVVVNAGDDEPANVQLVTVELNGKKIAELFSYDFPGHALTVVIPAGVSSVTLTATATDDQGNVATASPLTYQVAPDVGATMTGVVKTSDGTPVAGARVTIRESSLDETGLFVASDGSVDAAFEDSLAITDANGAWTIGAVNTYRGDVTVNVARIVAGDVQLMGHSAPQSLTRGETTTVPDVIADPAPPVVMKLALDTFGNWVEVHGQSMAVANGPAAHFFDITDPTRPRLRSTFTFGNGWSWVNAINFSDDGTRAIVITDEPKVYILDITDIAHPSTLGTIDITGYPVSAVTRGALTAIASGEVILIDSSNPSQPVIAATLTLPNNANLLSLAGNYAIVSESTVFSGSGVSSGIDVVDISDPAHPLLTGRVALTDGVGPMVIQGTRGYVVDQHELDLFEFSDPAHPTFTRNVTPLSPFETWSIAQSGTRLFVGGDAGDDPGRIAVADASGTPDAPPHTGDIATPETSAYHSALMAGGGNYLAVVGWPRQGNGFAAAYIGSAVWLVRIPEVTP